MDSYQGVFVSLYTTLDDRSNLCYSLERLTKVLKSTIIIIIIWSFSKLYRLTAYIINYKHKN